MKRYFSVPMALVLTFAPGIALANSQSGAGSTQPPHPAVEASHPLLPTALEPAVPSQTKSAESSPATSRDLYRNCNQLISQVRDQARGVAKSIYPADFNPDKTIRQHKELIQSLGNLKREHERFYQALTVEQQNTVATRNTSLMQSQDRLQNLATQMERELSDSTLHTRDIAEQAKTTQREMKSFEKEFRAMGNSLGMVAD